MKIFRQDVYVFLKQHLIYIFNNIMIHDIIEDTLKFIIIF